MENRFRDDYTLPLADDVRWELIQEAMDRCQDNPYEAASLIGLSGRTVLREVAARGLPWTPEMYSHANKLIPPSKVQEALRNAGGNVEAASVALGYRDGGAEIRRKIKNGTVKL